jgi:RNA ligase
MINVLNQYYDQKLLIKQTHPQLPLIIWNYSPKVQYEKLWDEITLKCRALITDFNGNIVAKSFNKFFNIEETNNFPNEPFTVYEKLDGSLILIFYYQNQWIVSSKASFISDHALEAQQIISSWNLDKLDKTKSYSGELIAPWNRIVCDYGKDRKVVLLAKFDNLGNEYSIEDYSKYFEIVKKYDGLNDYKNLKKIIRDDQEGFVVKFQSGFRMKVKGEEYLRLHKIVTGVSSTVIWEYLKENKPFDEFLNRVPDEFYSWVQKTKNELISNYKSIEDLSNSVYKEFDTRKETAEYFLQQKYPKVLFSMLDKKDFSDIIWKLVKPNYFCPFSQEENNET